MKARYRYRIYPNHPQRQMLARTFGCVRVVFNDALRRRQENYQTNQTSISSNELQKRLITQAKHTPERWWLAEVSNIALQQSVQDAGLAFKNFFQSLKGKRKGKKVGFPRFKLSTKIVRENQALVLEDLNVSGMVKNRRLARAISDVGWRQFRTLLEAKAIRYGRDFQVISRWEPTSQRCSCCGQLGGKKPLDVRAWTCLYCGAEHDRDLNAAINIKACIERSRNAAGGHPEALNACVEQRRNACVERSRNACVERSRNACVERSRNVRGGLCNSRSRVAADEAQTQLTDEQLSLFAG